MEPEQEDVTESDFMADLGMDDDDVAAFERFQQPPTKEGKRTLHLSQMIMQKIQEKEADIHTKISDEGSLKIEEIDPKVKEMYEEEYEMCWNAIAVARYQRLLRLYPSWGTGSKYYS